jgi:hypothetical protein
MSISEAQRFELHLGLQKALGDTMANTLMEHLPPSGWSDVVRVNELAEVEKRLTSRIEGLDGRVKMVITGGLAFALAIVAIQVQIVISIANI